MSPLCLIKFQYQPDVSANCYESQCSVLYNINMKNNSSTEAHPTPGEVCRSVGRVVITLISSSVDGASRGELNRDGNQGSATDDYLATPDQRFPSVSSQRIKKRSFHPALWNYLCLFYSGKSGRAAFEQTGIKQRQHAFANKQIDVHMVIMIYSLQQHKLNRWDEF